MNSSTYVRVAVAALGLSACADIVSKEADPHTPRSLGEPIQLGKVEDGSVYSVCFSSKGLLGFVASDNHLHIIDPDLRHECRHIPLARPGLWPCFSFVFTPDGELVSSVGKEKKICFWKPTSGEEAFSLNPVADDAQRVAPMATADNACAVPIVVSSDGRHLAIERIDKEEGNELLIYDLCTRRLVKSFSGAPAGGKRLAMSITAGRAAFSPDGSLVACTSFSSHIFLWDVGTGKKLQDLAGRDQPTSAVQFTPDGRFLVCSTAGSIRRSSTTADRLPIVDPITVWDIVGGKKLASFGGPSAGMLSVAVSADGRIVASGGEDGTVRLWELASGQQICYWNLQEGSVNSVAFSSGGEWIGAGTDGGGTYLLRTSPVAVTHEEEPLTGPRAFDSLWKDLGGAEAPKAYEALYQLAAGTHATVSFVKSHLQVVKAVPAPAVLELIRDLGADDFDRREAATKQLAALGPQAESALRKALEETNSDEARARIRPLLKALDAWVVSDPDMLRALRAIWVLERIGTPEARAVLEDLAKGAPEARQTQEAKNALDFLDKRAAAKP